MPILQIPSKINGLIIIIMTTQKACQKSLLCDSVRMGVIKRSSRVYVCARIIELKVTYVQLNKHLICKLQLQGQYHCMHCTQALMSNLVVHLSSSS